MKPSTSILLLALAGAADAALAAAAEDSVPNFQTFVSQAAQTGLAEIETGKIALRKSSDPAIREFAQRMVNDHARANDELASLAKARGMEPPTKLDVQHQAAVNAMKAAPAEKFDHAYSQHMNMDHSKAIALFEGASKSADLEMADFAKKALPTLREHKELAEKLPGNPKSSLAPGG
jgi:putative membrane protein